MVRAALLLMLLSGSSDASERIQLAQLHIEQRVIIRVSPAIPSYPAPPQQPTRPPPATARPPGPGRPADPPAIVWREKKGPKCLKMKDIRAADASNDSGIDMLTSDGRRYRAALEAGCRSSDFYSGFYMEPTRDGSLCAGRDDIQARSGADCRVQRFRQLLPRK